MNNLLKNKGNKKSEFYNNNLLLNIKRTKTACIFIGGIELLLFLVFSLPIINLPISDSTVRFYRLMYLFIVLWVTATYFTMYFLQKYENHLNELYMRGIIIVVYNGMLLWTVAIPILGRSQHTNIYYMAMIIIGVITYFKLYEIILVYIPSYMLIIIHTLGKNAAKTYNDDTLQVLINATCFVIISFVISRIFYKMAWDNFLTKRRIIHKNTELKKSAEKDFLTGLSNRRKLDQILKYEYIKAERFNLPLSIMILDLDNFKKYNDLYGHIEGDECLKKVSNIISKVVRRKDDCIFRYGGEEFCIILPYTEVENAVIVAEKIRSVVYDAKITHKTNENYGYITVSIGVAGFDDDIEKSDVEMIDLLESADKELYKAKATGRNKVSVHIHK